MSARRTPRDPVAQAALSRDSGAESLENLKAAVRERLGNVAADFLVDVLSGTHPLALADQYGEGGTSSLPALYRQLLIIIGHMRHGDLLGDMPELDMDGLNWLLAKLQNSGADFGLLYYGVHSDCPYHPKQHLEISGTASKRCPMCRCNLPTRNDITRHRDVGRPRKYCSNACRQRWYRWQEQARRAVPAAPQPPSSGSAAAGILTEQWPLRGQ